MRRQHRAGEALEVDYAGMTLSVIDKGVVRQAQIFVACLPCSDLTYAEASWTQGHEDWLGAHVRAFAYIGGCPKKVIYDYVPGNIIVVLCPPRLRGEPPRIAVAVTATGHISIRGQRAIRAALVRSAKLVFGEVPPKRSKEAGTPPMLPASS
jgi:transposase